MHPSLLPRYRGPAPIQHALLNGERESGVCVIEMLKMGDGAVDSGDIWGCEKTQIPNEFTFSQLRDLLGKQGGRLLVSVLRQMSRSELEPKPQQPFLDGSSKMAPMITAANSFVDPRSQTADQIVRIYRSLEKPVVLKIHKPDPNQDAGGTLLQLHKPEVLFFGSGPADRIIDPLPPGVRTTRATAEMTANIPRPPVGFGIYDRKGTNSFIIGCRDETYLRIRSVKEVNRALLDAREWWNGLNAGSNRPIRVSGLA